jgi:hypothetical protein
LKVGIEVEMEHTPDAKKAEQIARDHLAEDPEYYSKLNQADLIDEPDAKQDAEKLPPSGDEEAPAAKKEPVATDDKGKPMPGEKVPPGQVTPDQQAQVGQVPNADPAQAAPGDQGQAPAQPGTTPPQPGQQVPGQPVQPGQVPGQQMPGQQVPGQPGQPGQPGMQAPQRVSQTVDLVLGDAETAQNALDWCKALEMPNAAIDGTTLRVVVSSPIEMIVVQKVARAFGLELAGLTP